MIYAVAGELRSLGHEVFATYMGSTIPAGLKESALPVLGWERLALKPADTWCVPESWPNAIAPGVQAGARTVVYAQNWVFMLGILPDGVHWKQLPVEFLAVSRPVAWFMEEVLGLKTRALLPPVVESCFFQEGSRPSDRVRVAWMPRKNKAIATQIRQIALEALQKYPSPPAVEWVELHNMSQPELAAELSTSHIFLASSYAEGFGLPPAEAMASGCVPVGFTGLGGWEYMRQSSLAGQLGAHPPCPLDEKPWGSNGFYLPDGDVVSAGLALAKAVRLAAENGPEWQELSRNGRLAALAYTKDALRERLASIWR